MKPLNILLLFGASITVMGFSCFFIVMDYQAAVVTRFGKPVREITSGGIHAKLPWPLEAVHRVDMRMNILEARVDETITRDQRNIVTPMFAIWHVSNAKKFLESLGTTEEAAKKIENILINAKNTALGSRDFTRLFSKENNSLEIVQAEKEILSNVNSQSENILGITVLDVGLRQITLPPSNTEAVFERMRAERNRIASEFRAEGIKRAADIRAKAEAERAELLAKTEGEAATIRSEGDAAAAHILRDAYEKNPALFEFLRELEVLENVVSPDTIIVLGTDSPPFRMITQDPEAR